MLVGTTDLFIPSVNRPENNNASQYAETAEVLSLPTSDRLECDSLRISLSLLNELYALKLLLDATCRTLGDRCPISDGCPSWCADRRACLQASNLRGHSIASPRR